MLSSNRRGFIGRLAALLVVPKVVMSQPEQALSFPDAPIIPKVDAFFSEPDKTTAFNFDADRLGDLVEVSVQTDRFGPTYYCYEFTGCFASFPLPEVGDILHIDCGNFGMGEIVGEIIDISRVDTVRHGFRQTRTSIKMFNIKEK
jgi:hypothetical protein